MSTIKCTSQDVDMNIEKFQDPTGGQPTPAVNAELKQIPQMLIFTPTLTSPSTVDTDGWTTIQQRRRHRNMAPMPNHDQRPCFHEAKETRCRCCMPIFLPGENLPEDQVLDLIDISEWGGSMRRSITNRRANRSKAREASVWARANTKGRPFFADGGWQPTLKAARQRAQENVIRQHKAGFAFDSTRGYPGEGPPRARPNLDRDRMPDNPGRHWGKPLNFCQVANTKAKDGTGQWKPKAAPFDCKDTSHWHFGKDGKKGPFEGKGKPELQKSVPPGAARRIREKILRRQAYRCETTGCQVADHYHTRESTGGVLQPKAKLVRHIDDAGFMANLREAGLWDNFDESESEGEEECHSNALETAAAAGAWDPEVTHAPREAPTDWTPPSTPVSSDGEDDDEEEDAVPPATDAKYSSPVDLSTEGKLSPPPEHKALEEPPEQQAAPSDTGANRQRGPTDIEQLPSADEKMSTLAFTLLRDVMSPQLAADSALNAEHLPSYDEKAFRAHIDRLATASNDDVMDARHDPQPQPQPHEENKKKRAAGNAISTFTNVEKTAERKHRRAGRGVDFAVDNLASATDFLATIDPTRASWWQGGNYEDPPFITRPPRSIDGVRPLGEGPLHYRNLIQAEIDLGEGGITRVTDGLTTHPWFEPHRDLPNFDYDQKGARLPPFTPRGGALATVVATLYSTPLANAGTLLPSRRSQFFRINGIAGLAKWVIGPPKQMLAWVPPSTVNALGVHVHLWQNGENPTRQFRIVNPIGPEITTAAAHNLQGQQNTEHSLRSAPTLWDDLTVDCTPGMYPISLLTMLRKTAMNRVKIYPLLYEYLSYQTDNLAMRPQSIETKTLGVPMKMEYIGSTMPTEAILKSCTWSTGDTHILAIGPNGIALNWHGGEVDGQTVRNTVDFFLQALCFQQLRAILTHTGNMGGTTVPIVTKQ